MSKVILEKLQGNTNFIESITAIFIITAVSVFALVNLIFGYNLFLYVFAVLVGFWLSVFYPRAGVYALVFLTFVFERFFTLVPIYWNRTEYKIYPLDILFIGVILGTIFVGVGHSEKNKFKAVDWLVALFIFASAIYFFASVYFLQTDFAVAFSTFKNYAFYGLFYFAIVFLFSNRRKLFQLLKFMLAGAMTITIFIFIGIFRGEGMWTEFTPLSTPGARILAFPHAFYLTMTVLVALVLVSAGSKTSKIAASNVATSAVGRCGLHTLLLILIPIWAIGIVGSLMRHLWISLFVSFVFLFYFLPKENRQALKKIIFHYAFLAAVLFVLAVYLSFLFPNSTLNKIFSGVIGATGERFISTTRVSSDESLNWRRNVWQSAWREFKTTPFLGIGYGKKLSVEIGARYRDFVEVRNIHNSLLTVFIQMGLWSAALFGVIFWLLVKPAYKKLKQLKNGLGDDYSFLQLIFLVLFINYLTAFLFQTYLETNLLGMFFWIIMGLLRITNILYECTTK